MLQGMRKWCGEGAGALLKRAVRWGSVALLSVAVFVQIAGCPADQGQTQQGPPGPAGPQGPQGPAGPAGADGQDGQNGENGENGENGQDGQDGARGPAGPAGPTGPAGQNGQNGNNGQDGQDGSDGFNCWDLNENHVNDPSEDVNGDGQFDTLDCQGEGPFVVELADMTEGLLVVGDLVKATGQDLDQIEVVFVGDEEAPIVSQSATELVFQVPSGVQNGTNLVSIVNLSSATGAAEIVGGVNVHRLAAFLAQEQSKIVIVDTSNQSVVKTIATSLSKNALSSAPFCPAFANNGSLLIAPDGGTNAGDGSVTWVDLTHKDFVSGTVIVSAGAGDTGIVSVAVSPDNNIAAVVDDQRELIHTLQINSDFPPYASPLSAGSTFNAPVNSGPHCGTFATNESLVVAYSLSDQLAVLKRTGTTLAPMTTIASGQGPTQVKAIPSRSMVLSAETINPFLRGFLIGGFVLNSPAGDALPLTSVLAFDTSPNGQFAYTIPATGTPRVEAILVADVSLASIASSVDQASGNLMRSVAVEPVHGSFLYVGLSDGDFVDIFDITAGGTLTRRLLNPLAGNADLERSVGIGIQP